MRWYCLSCGSAAEAKVALHLRNYCDVLGMSDLYDMYLIPQEIVLTSTAGGDIHLKKERLFAGYLLVRIRLTPELKNLIQSISGVMGIVGNREGQPLPVFDSQIQRVTAMMIESESGRSKARRKPKIEPKTKVVITGGSFQNFTGEVVEHEGSRVIVTVNIFGRSAKASFDEELVVRESDMLHSSVSFEGR